MHLLLVLELRMKIQDVNWIRSITCWLSMTLKKVTRFSDRYAMEQLLQGLYFYVVVQKDLVLHFFLFCIWYLVLHPMCNCIVGGDPPIRSPVREYGQFSLYLRNEGIFLGSWWIESECVSNKLCEQRTTKHKSSWLSDIDFGLWPTCL